MLLPSEIESKSLIPAIRAILSKRLIRDYDLKEETVAKLLGITQAAVSNYIRGTPGDLSLVAKLEDNFEVMKMINDISKDLSTNNAYSPSTMTKFIQLCNFMRYTFIICDVHHSIESNIDKRICEQCEVLLTGSRFS